MSAKKNQLTDLDVKINAHHKREFEEWFGQMMREKLNRLMAHPRPYIPELSMTLDLHKKPILN